MKRLSRDSWLALGLFLLLTLVTAVAVVQQARASIEQPPLASFSNQPDGALALWLYLDELDYTVSNEGGALFAIPPAADLMLMLEPDPGFTGGEWEQIDSWVAEGGTLLIAGRSFGAAQAFGHFDFQQSFPRPENAAVSAQTPLLTSPPLDDDFAPPANVALRSDRDDFVTLLATQSGQPTAVTFTEENGRVILTTLPHLFTNEGLKETQNAAAVLNLINGTAELDTVWFDEWHHGVRQEAEIAANNWLQRTPAGRAILFVAAVIFIGLVLRGRAFGRPVTLAKDISRRAPLEYISGIANLSRRAGHRTAVLQDYRDRLKRDLGYRYRLNPTLPDEEFVARLAQYNPNLDANALLKLLQRLSQSNVSESEMIELAAEAAKFGKQ